MGGLIALDWGTSSLRSYRLDEAGNIRDTRARPWGIRQLPEGGFDAALMQITKGWPALPRLACGMVGSRGGWLEVPYLDLPADVATIGAASMRLVAADGRELSILPGLRNTRRADVMRGEETQLIGALAQRPDLMAHSTWVLPGTHSKWASVRDGCVTDFCTMMTGELFAVLDRHSILGSAAGTVEADPDAFVRGVTAARDAGAAGVFSRLFSARALMLDGTLPPGSVHDYLSGLLLGEELRSALASNRFATDAPLQLIGDAALCDRYRMAARCFDIAVVEPQVDAAAYGLWQVALRSGLVWTDQAPSPFTETRPC